MAVPFNSSSSPSAKGAQAELTACAWLVGLGYQVFRNVCPSGPADIAIWRQETGEFHLIDVKSVAPGNIYQRANGKLALAMSHNGRREGILRLVIAGGDVLGFHEFIDHQTEWHWPLSCPRFETSFSVNGRTYKQVAEDRRRRLR